MNDQKVFLLFQCCVSLCSVMVNMFYYDIVISEFEYPSHYYVHFWTNTLEKGMNLLIPQSMD